MDMMPRQSANCREMGDFVSVESTTNRYAELLSPTRNAFIAIVIIAIATRIVSWWNPVAHVDDQFYMLAGYDLLHGRWPYIDIWDRKPLGLFILYAGIAAIGGKSVLVMNLIATAFAAATAVVIRQIALRFAPPAAAALGALTYLLVIPLYGGQNGQTPVFYNLLIVGSMLLLLRAEEDGTASAIARNSLLSMLLCGLAMTIKQVNVAEGCFFGLSYLYLFYRAGKSSPAIMGWAAIMIAVALAPTAMDYVIYRVAGPEQAQAFLYANFVSIFQRKSFPVISRLASASYFFLYLFPLLGMAIAGFVRLWRTMPNRLSTRLLTGWMISALIGYVLVPSFYDHYALPIIVPLSVIAAINYGRDIGALYFLAYAFFCIYPGQIIDWPGNRQRAAQYERIRDMVDRARGSGCVFVADGPSRLYLDFPECRPTKYLFPDHLVLVVEANAIGTDPRRELKRILDQHPAVIVSRRAERGRHSPEVDQLLQDHLSRDYRRLIALPRGRSASVDGVDVWQRNDLPIPPLP